MKKEIVIDLSKDKTVKKALFRIGKARTRVRRLKNYMQEVATDVDKIFLRALRIKLADYPAHKSKLRPKFRSKKQHDLVMYMWRTRKIHLPYDRTHRLAESWIAKTTVTDNNIQLTIDTSDDKAQFVVGKIGLSPKKSDIKKYESPIQPFARDNGWVPAHKIIRPVVLKVKKYINQRMDEWEDHLLDDRDFHR